MVKFQARVEGRHCCAFQEGCVGGGSGGCRPLCAEPMQAPGGVGPGALPSGACAGSTSLAAPHLGPGAQAAPVRVCRMNEHKLLSHGQ